MRKECVHRAGQEFMLRFLCDVGAKSPLSSSTAAYPCHARRETTVYIVYSSYRAYRNPALEDWVIAGGVFGCDM